MILDPVDFMGVPDVELVAYGVPGPQGSKSPKGFNPRTGRAIMVESSKKVKPWRAAVEAAARSITDVPGWEPLDGPLVAAMTMTLPAPLWAVASFKRGVEPMATKYPDVSKLTRSTEDALSPKKDKKTGVVTFKGVWADDARVVGYVHQFKCYPGSSIPGALDAPGATIKLWRMT